MPSPLRRVFVARTCGLVDLCWTFVDARAADDSQHTHTEHAKICQIGCDARSACVPQKIWLIETEYCHKLKFADAHRWRKRSKRQRRHRKLISHFFLSVRANHCTISPSPQPIGPLLENELGAAAAALATARATAYSDAQQCAHTQKRSRIRSARV